MTRHIKAILALSAAISPAALATAWIAIELARLAYERRDAAEDEATKLAGALSEAHQTTDTAQADVERLTRLLALSEDRAAELDTCKALYAAACEHADHLTRELAHENEANAADRETAQRLRGELARAAKHAQDDTDAWRKAAARAEKAEADAAQARTAEQAAYEREAAVGRRAELEENSLAQRTAELDTCQGALAIANHRIAVLESQAATLSTRTVTLAGAAPAEPVAAPPVACAWCGEPVEEDWERQGHFAWANDKLLVSLGGADKLPLCSGDTNIEDQLVRARHAARARPPVTAVPATVARGTTMRRRLDGSLWTVADMSTLAMTVKSCATSEELHLLLTEYTFAQWEPATVEPLTPATLAPHPQGRS